MELYTSVAYDASHQLTAAYSTSFSKSITLFDKALQPHIYAVYGLVRIADEIVDTYHGHDQAKLLAELEAETYAAIQRGFSTNPIIHAFAVTARTYSIGRDLIRPFFVSMAMDLVPQEYTPERYHTYIYGSAEVVGLMCLRVFVGGDEKAYARLQKGARALGAAYQKVNFLRDMAADYTQLGRVYFPGTTFETFGEQNKHRVIADIQKDITTAQKALPKLPVTSRDAVELSLAYYGALLAKLKRTPIALLKRHRVRISSFEKAGLLAGTMLKRKFRRV